MIFRPYSQKEVVFIMLNKDIQQIRIDVVEMLLETCKNEPEKMYEG